jgi:hypothetical protein
MCGLGREIEYEQRLNEDLAVAVDGQADILLYHSSEEAGESHVTS